MYAAPPAASTYDASAAPVRFLVVCDTILGPLTRSVTIPADFSNSATESSPIMNSLENGESSPASPFLRSSTYSLCAASTCLCNLFCSSLCASLLIVMYPRADPPSTASMFPACVTGPSNRACFSDIDESMLVYCPLAFLGCDEVGLISPDTTAGSTFGDVPWQHAAPSPQSSAVFLFLTVRTIVSGSIASDSRFLLSLACLLASAACLIRATIAAVPAPTANASAPLPSISPTF